jgi:hypothetical protein
MAELSGTKISGTGGNGQGGKQPIRYIPDMQSLGSTGQDTMAQQESAAMYREPAAPQASLRDLLSPTEAPEESISAGVGFGRGAGPEALPAGLGGPRAIENTEIVYKYLPALMEAAKLPDAPDSYKSFLSYLMGNLQ